MKESCSCNSRYSCS